MPISPKPVIIGAGDGTRTRNRLLGRQERCQLRYPRGTLRLRALGTIAHKVAANLTKCTRRQGSLTTLRRLLREAAITADHSPAGAKARSGTKHRSVQFKRVFGHGRRRPVNPPQPFIHQLVSHGSRAATGRNGTLSNAPVLCVQMATAPGWANAKGGGNRGSNNRDDDHNRSGSRGE